jgi:hypothetical protein
MTMRKPPSRAARRARARAHETLVRDLDRLARLEPGGCPERPVVVASPAQVEVIAERKPCPLCQGSLRVEEHAAETVDGVRLRVARMVCVVCGTRRAFYFALEAPRLH